nr:MAG TPA: hypothetical protein [Caudoviricetes sp.]
MWGCAGERLIPFPVFSVLSSCSACFSCWGAQCQGRLSATLLALLRDSNDRSVCLCLGRLVIAVSGFLRIGRPAASES